MTTILIIAMILYISYLAVDLVLTSTNLREPVHSTFEYTMRATLEASFAIGIYLDGGAYTAIIAVLWALSASFELYRAIKASV